MVSISLRQDSLHPGTEQYRFKLNVLDIMLLALGFELLKNLIEKEARRLLYWTERS